MDNEQQPHPAEQPPQSPIVTSQIQTRSRSLKRWLLTIVLFLLAVGIGAGATYALLQKNDDKDGQTNQTQGNKTTSQNSQEENTASNTSWHTVVFGDVNRTPNLAIKLAFPENYQAIAYSNGPDGMRSLFGDNEGSATYEAGDWKIGNPNNGDGDTWGDIQIMGIAKDWYSRNGYAPYGGSNGDSFASEKFNATINGYPFYTAAEKNASLKALASDTAACAKDPAKGLTISGQFKVCYKPSLTRQAYASYHPQIMLSGYAVIKDVPYVLFGYVDVQSGLDGYSDAQLNKAGDNFLAGKIPAQTQKNITEFITAFKHSSVATKQ